MEADQEAEMAKMRNNTSSKINKLEKKLKTDEEKIKKENKHINKLSQELKTEQDKE